MTSPNEPAIRPGDTITLGDVLSFQFGEFLPADDPLSEWLVLVAGSLNDLAFVHARLEEDDDKAHQNLYWLRLGVAHFFEAGKTLERFRSTSEVRAYIASLSDEVQALYEQCLAISAELRRELRFIRNTLFHYLPTVDGDRVIANALQTLANERSTLQTGKLRDARSTFADDVAAAIFTRAAGVEWGEVSELKSQERVGAMQLRIREAVTAFVRFANPALMERVSRAVAEGIGFYKVDPVDPNDWRQGWRIVARPGASEEDVSE